MGNEVFPDLPGLKWEGTKKPKWSTKIHETTNGKETRAAYWSYPKWFFSLAYEFLDESELVRDLQTLGGFFLARKGSFDSFLYRDSADNSVEDQVLGTGDGIRIDFQALRSFGEFDEPIKNIEEETLFVYLDGVQTTSFTVSDTGLISFLSPPALGIVVTTTFSFYFRCRFLQDELEFAEFMAQLWELKKLEMVTVK